MDDPLLTLDSVRKSFGGVAAVRGVTTTIARGEIRGLIGPNGSGKTTLLNLIGGQVRPDGGQIRLEGRPIQALPPDAVASRGIARTFQLPRVFPHMTVLENLLLPLCADHRRTGWADGRREADELLRLAQLDRLAYTEARMLSGGQAMLLQLARCLIQRPLALCLLDEPFAGVHPGIKAQMVAAIHEVNRARGVAFLIVSHEMATLRRLAERVSVMHDGAWIADGPLDQVARDPHVIEAYLGRAGLDPAAPRGQV